MILADNSEPAELIKLVQQAVPVVVSPLNSMHISDYFFGNYEGKRLQFSRKQAGELLGNIDEAEDQLRDYYEQADENYQIIEGIISPVRLAVKGKHSHASTDVSTRGTAGGTFAYKVDNNYISEHSYNATVSMLYVWLHRLAKAGITTYWTINWVETARLLMTIYRNEQKPPEEHTTLQRVIRPRIQVKEPEPFLKALMFLSNAYRLQIGEVKAKAITEKFCNILDLATSSVSDITEVEGIGRKMAERLLSALGREI